MLRIMVANMSGSEPEPSPPTVKSVFSMSSQVFTFEVCQVAHRLTWSLTLPSQVKRRASYCVALPPISGSIAMPRPIMPIAVPSLGATL